MTDALKAELIERIVAGKVLVVVGTGVSMAVTEDPLASWKGLITNGIERCADLRLRDATWCELQETLLNKGDLDDLLGVAEQVSRRLGWKPTEPCNGDWNEWLRRTVGNLRPKHPELIEAIRDLGVPIATLNYDNLLTDVTGRTPLTWQEPEQWLPVLEGDDQAILHLHGHWRRRSSVILGVRAYDALIGKDLAQHLQKVVATTLSLLFIGCVGTLKDPNFETLRAWMMRARSFEHHHYLLLCHPELNELKKAISEEQLREACIVPVLYGEQHAELLSFIRDLASKPSPRSPPANPADLFVNTIIEKGLSPFLTDIGLAEFTVDWLDNEASVPRLFGRALIKAFAMRADKWGSAGGAALLDILMQLPFYKDVERQMQALLQYIDAELKPRKDVRQVLDGQRPGKVGAEVARNVLLDVQAVLALNCSIETLTSTLSALMSKDNITVIFLNLSSSIEQYKDILVPQPPLELSVFEEDPKGLDRFLYGTQKSSFLGREREIHELETFLAAPQRFCWWMVTGEGGLGKSRLALELCLRNGNVWRTGFLPTSFFLDDYRDWSPNQSTLIIADYAAYRAVDIGHLMRIIKTRADNNNVSFPVRFLLLERHERKYFRGEIEDIDVMQETWFRRLLGVGTDRQAIISAWYAKRAPMILGALNQDATWTIICTFAFGKDKWPNEKRGKFLSILETIDPHLCRPLYAALLGDAIGAGREYAKFRTLDTLIDILYREEQRFWIPQWTLDGITSQEDRDNDKDLLAIATMAGGIDTEIVSLPHNIKAMIRRRSFSSKRYARMAPGSTDTRLRPLTPDIIGEAFVLEWLKPSNPLQTERLERIKAMALSLNGDNTASFLYRAETDVPDHPTLRWLS